MKHLFTLLFVFGAGLTLSAQTVVKKTINVNDLSFKMVQVQGGRFNMGGTAEQDPILVEDDEWPIHVVTLSDYYIGETEVTQALWQEIMGENRPRRLPRPHHLPKRKENSAITQPKVILSPA